MSQGLGVGTTSAAPEAPDDEGSRPHQRGICWASFSGETHGATMLRMVPYDIQTRILACSETRNKREGMWALGTRRRLVVRLRPVRPMVTQARDAAETLPRPRVCMSRHTASHKPVHRKTVSQSVFPLLSPPACETNICPNPRTTRCIVVLII